MKHVEKTYAAFQLKAASTYDKAYEQAQPFIAPASGLATAGLAYKAHGDISKAQGLLNSWADETAAAVGDGTRSLTNADQAVKAYTDGGRKVIQQRILGLPIPHWTMQASVPFRGQRGENGLKGFGEYGRYLKERMFGRQNAELNPANTSMHAHYRKFFKAAPGGDAALQNYMHTFGFTGMDKLNPIGKQVVNDKELSLANKLLRLRQVDPDGYQEFRKFVPTLVGRLAGSGKKGLIHGGLSDAYRSLLTPQIANILKYTKGLGGAGLAFAGVSGAAALANTAADHGWLGKMASVNRDGESPRIGLGSVAPWAGGIGLGASGVKDLTSPMNIGISYGEMPDVGAGHSTPARSVKQMLEELQGRAGTPKFNTFDLKRNNLGWVDPAASTSRKYTGLIDTGMGAYIPTGDEIHHAPFMANAKMHVPETRPRVATGGFLGVQTDLGKLGTPGQAANAHRGNNPFKNWLGRQMGHPDRMITYEPNMNELYADPVTKRLKLMNVGSVGFPTITPEALSTLKTLQTTDKQTLIADMLSENIGTPKNQELLKQLGDKRLVVVSGSGRGDQAGYRALEIQKELEARGLHGKYQVASLLGDSKTRTPYAHLAEQHPGIMAFDRLPQKYYIGLPAMADAHVASSGTSALMEALGTKSHLIFHPSSNAIRNAEGAGGLDLWKKHGIKDAENVLAKFFGVDLDGWNEGNKRFAWGLPGVSNEQSIKDIVDRITDDATHSPEAAAARAQRAAHMIESHGNAKAKMTNMLGDWLKSRRSFNVMKGTAKLGGGLGLGALGLLPMWMEGRKVKAQAAAAREQAAAWAARSPMEKMKNYFMGLKPQAA